jgi:ABC-type amino acid transport substrate-binding protein
MQGKMGGSCHPFFLSMSLRAAFLVLLSTGACASDLRVLVDTGTEMPMARFRSGALVEGIHRDIGLELGAKLRMPVRFVALPRKRIERALLDGEADILCSYVPEWLGARFTWSQPFVPIVQVLVTNKTAERPHSIEDLRGKPVGTVLGYSHPEMAVLGKQFIRVDGATTEQNLRKLGAGRVQYALTGKSFLEYRMKLNDPIMSIHPPMVISTYMGRCALSPRSSLRLAELDGAISALVKDGGLNAILAKYR